MLNKNAKKLLEQHIEYAENELSHKFEHKEQLEKQLKRTTERIAELEERINDYRAALQE